MRLEAIRCVWCDRLFVPGAWGQNYELELAGVKICAVCADKWEDNVVLQRRNAVHCYLDGEHHLQTFTGHELPVRVTEWLPLRDWRGRPYATGRAVDDAGGEWSFKARLDTATGKMRPLR